MYKVGDKVRIADQRLHWMNNEGRMDKWLRKTMTIREIEGPWFKMEEDKGEHRGDGWFWKAEGFRPLEEHEEEPKMKYKVGDKVRITKERTRGMVDRMEHWCGQTMTINKVFDSGYRMEEDQHEGGGWWWNDDNIEGLAEETPAEGLSDEMFKLMFGF